MSKDKLQHARTCVYNVNYHIVWSVKYRRKVLDGNVEIYLKQVLREVAEDKGFNLFLAEVGERDHVHVFVSAHPKFSPSYIAKMLKGISGRRIFLQFPEIKQSLWRGRLWNSSFYLETVGSVSEENIKTYIARQQTRG